MGQGVGHEERGVRREHTAGRQADGAETVPGGGGSFVEKEGQEGGSGNGAKEASDTRRGNRESGDSGGVQVARFMCAGR